MSIKNMKKQSKKELIARWTKEYLDMCNQRLVNGDYWSPFGEFEGRLDLRGFQMEKPLKYVNLDAIDFAHGSTVRVGQILSNAVTNCCFEDFGMSTNMRTKFQDCNMKKLKARGAAIHGEFVNCDFSGANLSMLHPGSGGMFDNCSFDHVNFKGAHLIRGTFVNCSFDGAKFGKGSFGSSKFVGGMPSRDQFGDTIVDHLQLDGEPLGWKTDINY